MPASKKDLKKAKQRADAKAGIVPEPKKAANTEATCTQCQRVFRTTKRNVEAKTHWETQHSKTTFEVCFPGETYEQ